MPVELSLEIEKLVPSSNSLIIGNIIISKKTDYRIHPRNQLNDDFSRSKYLFASFSWSFGILLWEICTMGGSPYPGIKMEDIFSYLQSGKRMEQPTSCPDELYHIMQLCWEEEPVKRPFFHEVVSYLERILQDKYTVKF